MRDDSLLKLEKKLDTYSTKDILLSKFMLKPNINKSVILQGNNFLNNIGNFIDNFKKQNNEILDDQEKVKEMNIEEGAELVKNNSNKKIKTNKMKKMRPSAYEKNKEIAIDKDNLLLENSKEKKFVELNLKLGVLDIKKKDNSKPLIEEIPEYTADNLKSEEDSIKFEKESDCSESDKVESQNLEIIRTQKGKNYLEVLKRNDTLLKNVINSQSLEKDENNCIDNYPFLDLKNDAFNKEVLNFLVENSKNKNNEIKKKKKRILNNNIKKNSKN